jgi:hypothetical protein
MAAVGLDHLVAYVIEMGVPPGYWFWSGSDPWYRCIQGCGDYSTDIVSCMEGLCYAGELTEVHARVNDLVLEQLPIGCLPGSSGVYLWCVEVYV